MRLAFVDTETTGTRPTYDRIIEIAVIVYEDNQIVDTFETLINPQISFDPFITEITGIRPTDLTNAPIFEDIALRLKEILTDTVLVAHNARFDYAFIKNEFKRLHIPYTTPTLCTVKLSRNLYPHHHNHSLDHIISRFNINCESRHRALGDAQVLVDFYNYLLVNVPSENLQSTVNKLLGHPSVPVNIDPDILFNLPESPGVYIFYNDHHLPLYVGKSKNIKTRVLSHFHGDVNSSKEMKLAQTTHYIDTQITGGELSALLLESQLVKQLQPLHNRLLRHARKLILATKKLDSCGYYTVNLETVTQIDHSQLNDIIGIFKSKRQAQNALTEITEVYQLCPKIIGLENSKSHCFAYHLGKCKGACTGLESPLFYNIRFQQAFSSNRIKPWPFPGPILITESNLDDDVHNYFIADQWCILSEFDQFPDSSSDIENNISPSYSAGMPAPSTPKNQYSFDLDTYKILSRFILNPQNQAKIKILK